VHSAAQQIPLFDDTAATEAEPSGFRVRVSGRARRLSIKVYPRGTVEVIVPRRTRARDVRAFVEEHREWIRATRASFAALHPPEPFRLPQRIVLPAIGRTFAVRYEPRSSETGVACRARGEEEIVLTGRTGDARLCVEALKRWLARVAKEAFAPRLRLLAATTGNSYKRLRVAGQKTCWGSHSGTGTLSLNYCLLFLEPALVRYLMIHELCHARHMNHSRRFWALVRRFEPDYRRLDRQLAESWRDIPAWVGIY
jgi:predicted metal-dependent hydrolase